MLSVCMLSLDVEVRQPTRQSLVTGRACRIVVIDDVLLRHLPLAVTIASGKHTCLLFLKLYLVDQRYEFTR